ncbi:AraC family transcriptional regulator [Hahella sp. CR1]|uniref:AraC family transcriptional regulator n=1 Tax=Hahella sp. CR1 TaxID=2992807 RepID=UPI002442E6BA|nr:AraC family transcriptional regulator [Hahella sp. CR1]MDG9669517.1 AraC family transcriptional regulator [Hahella sp. CR1]
MSKPVKDNTSIAYLWQDQALLITSEYKQYRINHSADLLIVSLEGSITFTTPCSSAPGNAKVLVVPQRQAINIDFNNYLTAIITLDCFGAGKQFIKDHFLFETVNNIWCEFHCENDFVSQLQYIYAERPENSCCRARLDQFLSQGSLPKLSMDHRIRKAMLWVLNDPADTLTNKEVATMLGLSEHHFMRLFKKSYGLSFSKFKQCCRIKAFFKGYGESQNITDAAHYAGFVDLPHFSNTYKKILGHAPSAFFHKNNPLQVMCA